MFIRDFHRFMKAMAAMLCFTMAVYPFHTYGITPKSDRYEYPSGSQYGAFILERIQTFSTMVEFDEDWKPDPDAWPDEQTLFLGTAGASKTAGVGIELGEFVKPGGLSMLQGYEARKVADGVYDSGFCTTTSSVTRGATTDSQCITVKSKDGQNIEICPGSELYNQLSQPPIPGIPKLALEVAVASDCGGFNVGPMDCYEDINGDTQCPDNTGDRESTCGELEADPSCSFVRSECIEGARGEESGHCYAYEDTYDCGYSVDIPTWEKTETYQCGGPVRCMGDDCLDPSRPPSAADDFGKIAGLLDAAQSMAEDLDCQPDGTGTGCKVFTGEDRDCKAALGGWVDCCEKPKGVSLTDYITTIRSARVVDRSMTGLETSSKAFSAIQDGYTALRNPVANGFSKITQPFTSATGNISNAVSGIQTQLRQQASKIVSKGFEMVGQSMPEALGGAIEGTSGQTITQAVLGEAVAAFLGVVMMIYAIYQIANLIVNIIWKCSKEELDLGVQRQMKNCSKIGTYCASKSLFGCVEKRTSFCCFNSPLSRIMQEQIRPQLSMSFGSAEDPDCSGLPIERFGEINWDRVNLDEWLGILQQTGNFPGTGDVSLEGLTGSGHRLSGAGESEGDRLNTLDRTLERLGDGVDADAIRKGAINSVPISTGAP